MTTKSTLALILLVAVTCAVYLPVANHGFITYDDGAYVTENPHVRAGLTWDGVRWAFTTGHAANWHPLTWLSHMADWEAYGNKPGAHHLVSLAFHVVNLLLVFRILLLMTGAVWRSLVVAGLFALHPLHVESVAWVAERKDVLSACFGLLTLWAYCRYAARPGLWRYALALLLFALGLMAKPMLVTWPFVLLLLDWWPLGRWRRREGEVRRKNPGVRSQESGVRSQNPVSSWGLLLLEKVPFLLLAVASSVVTFLVQRHGGAVAAMATWPLEMRVANAVIAYVAYLWKMVWPVNLAVMYPLPTAFSPELAAGAALFMGIVTLGVVWRARWQPYLAVGWLWYVGTLVPVIGLVKVGEARMADRYTYLPLIGVFVLVVWVVAEWAGRWRRGRLVAGLAAMAVLVACGAVTVRQVGVWKSTVSVFEHAVAAGEASATAYNNLGVDLADQGRFAEEIVQYRKGLRLDPYHIEILNSLGAALASQGRFDEAVVTLRKALRLNPEYAEAHSNLGAALASQGHLDEAIAHLERALRRQPDDAKARNNLGGALTLQGRFDEAIVQFNLALRLKPDYEDARKNLRRALAAKEKQR
jgi:Flp pilus assembly protein TadD